MGFVFAAVWEGSSNFSGLKKSVRGIAPVQISKFTVDIPILQWTKANENLSHCNGVVTVFDRFLHKMKKSFFFFFFWNNPREKERSSDAEL